MSVLNIRSISGRAPWRRVAVVTAVAAVCVSSVATPADAHPISGGSVVTSQQVARWGAGWLADQISAGGGHLESFGFPDVSDTAYAVIGLRAAGVGRDAANQAVAYLKTQLTDALKTADGTDNPGLVGYDILAAVASGQDPYHFGGTGSVNNLVARLLATVRTTGSDAGLVGTGDPTYDGAFRQGIALSALAAAGVRTSDARVRSALAWLTTQQCSNGLWLSYRATTTTACPAADPSTFAGPDTNSSAQAIQGLAAYGLTPRRAAAVASLRAVQSSDGGFPYLAAADQTSDPDSTALVIQAGLAEGAAVSTWKKGTATPFTALASYQLGCGDAAADRGAFFYPGSRSSNLLATVQSVPAAAGSTFADVEYTPATTAVPHPVCAA